MKDFQIISKLSDGEYSTVFKVRRNEDKKTYVLKKVKLFNLSNLEKENALNEVRLLASVKSIFVISYKDAFFDEKDNTLCIIIEFADRGDLFQKITEHKKSAKFFDESDIWRIFIQLVKGLKSLHDLKILHRDIKPSNVFLFSNGSPKLGDLKKSKVARRGLGYTQTGTPNYASPEVWKNEPYDNKSDIWSLGCVLYEMITLRPPFRAKNMEGLYNKVCKGQYSKIPDRFSDDLFQVVQFLLQVNPNSRPNCEEILNHPIVDKRIAYFKSFASKEEPKDKCLLKTFQMPKNLLLLSDKLPNTNYDKQLYKRNNYDQNKNYRSFSKAGNNKKEEIESKDLSKRIYIKEPQELSSLLNIPEEKLIKRNNNDNLNVNNKKHSSNTIINNSHSLNNIITEKSANNNNINSSNNLVSKNLSSNPVNNNKIILKKDNKNYDDLNSQQKNDIRRIMLGNNEFNRRKGYVKQLFLYYV